jgi:hypothetical protein
MSTSINSSGVTFPDSTTQTTAALTTTTTANGVGSYAMIQFVRNGGTYTPSFGSNYSVGTGGSQVLVLGFGDSGCYGISMGWGSYYGVISGTWKYMSVDYGGNNYNGGIAVRIA